MKDERLLKESTEEELLPLMRWYFVSLQAVLALLKLKLQKVLLPALHCPAADCRSLVTSSNDHQSPLPPPPPLLLDHDLRNCVHPCWDRRLAGEPTLIELGTSHWRRDSGYKTSDTGDLGWVVQAFFCWTNILMLQCCLFVWCGSQCKGLGRNEGHKYCYYV